MNSQVTGSSPSSEEPLLRRSSDELISAFRSLRTRADVADLLEVPERHLVYLLYRMPEATRYRTFLVKKRTGGTRTIQRPHRSLAQVQRKLNLVLRLVYSPRPSAHGFVEERSILTNSLNHTGKRFVLNIDLQDFFPSINFGRVRGLLMAKPYQVSATAATILAQLTCHEGVLPQGAPTSPVISNMICSRLDGELQRLAKRHRCTYTRYADDITFSTTLRQFPKSIAAPASDSWAHNDVVIGDDLNSIIKSNGFSINSSKVRILFRNHHQEVTGLTVNRAPNVKRRYVRQIRAMLHAWEKYGYDAAESDFLKKYDRRSRNPRFNPPGFGRVVRGKLDFLKMVKGKHDLSYQRLWNKLHSLDASFAPYRLDNADDPDDSVDNDTVWKYWGERYERIIYMVEVDQDGELSTGTSFMFGPHDIATCAHVLLGGDATIYLEGSTASILRQDVRLHNLGPEKVDGALVRIGNPSPGGFIPLRPTSEKLIFGEQVAVLGYQTIPGAQPGLTVLAGIVETLRTDYSGDVNLIFVSMNISGGLSGGPVIDRSGRLVGIATGKTWEQTEEGVPPVAMFQVLAARHLLEIG